MESRRLLDNAKEDRPVIDESIQARFWLYVIHFLRWILCTLSERVAALELWAMGAEESHRQAEIRNPKFMFVRIHNEARDDYYCEVLLDTGSSFNLISTRRVSELGLSYKRTDKEEEEAIITDLDRTKSHPLGSLKIDYRGGHHGHSPQGVEASTFYVLEYVPCEMLLGQPALQDLNVLTLDPLYFSEPPRRTPKERILTVPESERRKRGVYFAGRRNGGFQKTFFPTPIGGQPPRPIRR